MKPPGAASRAKRALVLGQEPGRLPDPDLGGHRQQLGALDRPGHAEQQRHRDAAGAHPARPSAVDRAGSKVRLLTMWVACRRLSHIACTVRSSWMVGWDSG